MLTRMPSGAGRQAIGYCVVPHSSRLLPYGVGTHSFLLVCDGLALPPNCSTYYLTVPYLTIC